MIVIPGAKDKQLITIINAPSVLPLTSPDSAMDEVILSEIFEEKLAAKITNDPDESQFLLLASMGWIT